MTKVAAIQMCSSHVVDDNLNMAANLISEAAHQGAQLILLPENFAFMGLNEKDKLAEREVFGDGKIQAFLSQQALRHQVWMIGGTIPIASNEENRVRAASLVFNDKGECVARYDKIHLFDVVISDNEKYRESDTIQPGDKIVTVETPFGKLGMAVCYDVRFPELFRVMFNEGANMMLLPSAFTVRTGMAHWEVLTRSRAIENFSYVIGAGQGGMHTNGRKTYGHSIIVEPWGNIAAIKNDTDSGVIYATIDLAKMQEIRRSIPVAQHQRIFFDTKELTQHRVSAPL